MGVTFDSLAEFTKLDMLYDIIAFIVSILDGSPLGHLTTFIAMYTNFTCNNALCASPYRGSKLTLRSLIEKKRCIYEIPVDFIVV